MTVLVVGSTGQLGTAIVRRLQADGVTARALVRPGSDHAHLLGAGVELAYGDLTDRDSMVRACRGADAVIATANVVFPRTRYSFAVDEAQGYANLIAAARDARVQRLVYASVPLKPPWEAGIPTFTMKRAVERALVQSGVPFTIFRCALFMDEYFALMGSSIPLRHAEAASLARPYWLPRAYMRLSRSLVQRGVALAPASAESRHAFIAVADVAAFMVNCLSHPDTTRRTLSIGGPENLSWREVADIYEMLLQRRVRVLACPGFAARLGFHAARPFSEATSNAIGLMWILSKSETLMDTGELAATLGVPLTTAARFLTSKLGAPGRLATQPAPPV